MLILADAFRPQHRKLMFLNTPTIDISLLFYTSKIQLNILFTNILIQNITKNNTFTLLLVLNI